MTDKNNLAEKLSIIFSVPTIAFIVVCFFTFLPSPFPNLYINPWLALFLGILFISILPIAPVLYAARGKSVDVYISERAERPKFFILAIIIYIFVALVFYLLSIFALMVLSIAYAAVTASVTLVSFYWKISVHAAGISGPITALTFIYGWLFGLFFLILLPVGWARLALKAHNIEQYAVGAIIASLVTLIIYIMFLI
jgi:membrane-associated phospholipid phosphatase